MFPFYKKTVTPDPVFEAALPLNTSHDALRGQLRDALMKDYNVTDVWSNDGPWVMAGGVFPTHVVYDWKGQTLKRPYTVTAGAAGTTPTITLGKAKNVHIAYVDSATESGMSVLMEPPTGTEESREAYENAQNVTVTP